MNTDNVIYLMMPYIFHGSDHIYKQTFHAEFYLELSHFFTKPFYKTMVLKNGKMFEDPYALIFCIFYKKMRCEKGVSKCRHSREIM